MYLKKVKFGLASLALVFLSIPVVLIVGSLLPMVDAQVVLFVTILAAVLGGYSIVYRWRAW